MNWIKQIFLISVLIASLVSCTKDSATIPCSGDCIPGNVSYSNDIAPIIMQSCATNQGPGTGCHDSWIFDYENVKGRVEKGDFKRAIVDKRNMPPIPNNFNIQPLTEEEIRMFECWICDGAPNN